MWSLDGDAHSVQLYSDVSAEWVSGECRDCLAGAWRTPVANRSVGNRDDIAQWDYSVISGKSQSSDDSNLNDRRGIEVELEERGWPPHRVYGTKSERTHLTMLLS